MYTYVCIHPYAYLFITGIGINDAVVEAVIICSYLDQHQNKP